MQDVHLGFLIAILPALAGHHGTRSARVIKSGLIHDLVHGIRHSGTVYIIILSVKQRCHRIWIIRIDLNREVGKYNGNVNALVNNSIFTQDKGD